jgi:oligopeptide transport system substrate-binding protein
LSFIPFTTLAKPTTFSKKQVLRISNGAEPKDIDPALSTGIPEGHIIEALFEGLTSTSPFEKDPVPGIAESWKITEGGLVYTFTLREDAKWSDGKDLTAQDFVYSWRRTLDPKTASEYAYQLYPVKNGEAYNTGKIKDPTTLGVQAVNSKTLQVTLEHPTPYFLYLTAFMTLYPTPEHVIQLHPTNWTLAKHIVSNGPFKLTEARIHDHIKAVANEHYWDRKNVKLQEIYIYPTENKQTEEQTFITGKIHMTSTVPSMRVPYYESELKKGKPSPLRIQPIYGTYYYRFNTTRKPLNDPRVRRALAMTIDRKLIVDNIAHGGRTLASSFTPPSADYSFPGSLPKTLNDDVIQEAKKLLAQAGYPEGKNMRKIRILYDTDEDNKRIAIAIQDMWHKHLGIEVEIFNEEWKVYLESLRTLNFDVARSRWIGDYPDPNTFLDIFMSQGGNNNTGWSNKTYDEYLHKAAISLKPTERMSIFSQAEELLMKELPLAPIFFYSNLRLVKDTLHLFNPSTGESTPWASDLMDHIFFKYMVLTETTR